MRPEDLCKRMIVARAGLDATRVRDGRLDQAELAAAGDAVAWLRELPMTFDANGKVAIGRVARKTRSQRRQGKLDFLVIDLVTHVVHEGKIQSREQQVAQVSRVVSDLAVELEIPVLITAQVNRDAAKRQNKKPNHETDLRESAALGHDASIVMMPWRSDDWTPVRTDVVVSKNRNGPLGECSLKRVPRFQRFETYTYQGQLEPDRKGLE